MIKENNMNRMNDEQINQTLDEFFMNVSEIMKPYFSQFGYKKKLLRGHSRIVFEKIIGGKFRSTIDYFCDIKFG
jgi:hypothetical protein